MLFKKMYWVNVIGLILRLIKYINLKEQSLATKLIVTKNYHLTQ